MNTENKGLGNSNYFVREIHVLIGVLPVTSSLNFKPYSCLVIV